MSGWGRLLLYVFLGLIVGAAHYIALFYTREITWSDSAFNYRTDVYPIGMSLIAGWAFAATLLLIERLAPWRRVRLLCWSLLIAVLYSSVVIFLPRAVVGSFDSVMGVLEGDFGLADRAVALLRAWVVTASALLSFSFSPFFYCTRH